MSTSAIADVIRYYRDCFQASFFSSAGYGLFDQKDLVPLAIAHLDDGIPWSEQWQQQYVIDADQVHLMRIDGITLIPEPNSAATTDAHYRPSRVAQMNAWADNPQAEPDWDEEWQQQLQADTEPAPQLTVASLPSLSNLADWLQEQAEQSTERRQLAVSVLFLMPKNFRATAHKADFVAYLDRLTHQHHNPDSLLWQSLLRQSVMPVTTTPTPELPFLSQRQNQALHSARTRRFSLIQGPPGTGKSRLLATLAAQLASDNKAVLLTSHSDHALTVLREKLVQDIGLDERWLVHIGPGRRTRKLAEHLSRLLTRSDEPAAPTRAMPGAWADFHRSETRLRRQLAREPQLTENWLTGELTGSQSLKRRWWSLWHRDHHHLNRTIDTLHASVDQLARAFGADLNRQLHQAFQFSRTKNSDAWSTLAQRLKRGSLRESVGHLNQRRDDVFTPTDGLKIWLIKLDDLPEQAFGLFDTVIIDEATQVNMAEAIPALALSRHAVVAGDPRQLRHYSFLSREQEARIAGSLNLNPDDVVSFRDTSLLDYSEQYLTGISAFDACHQLDEHYRSVPPLMDFNSRQFYQGDVQVLTGLNQVNSLKLHLNWVMTEGQRVNKINQAEASVLIEHLTQLINRERNQPVSKKTTLGVLSFFRDQTEHLKQQILQTCSLSDIRAHQVKVGTPFSFQGEERDHMLISCAIDDHSHPGTWGYLNQPDVFNVATSRARRQQTLFLSASPAELPVNSVLRSYYDFSRTPPTSATAPEQSLPWLRHLLPALQDAGFRTLAQQYIADIPIDLILEADGRTLAVDLIGFPSEVGQAIHLDRYLALFRAGIPLFPFSAREWVLNPNGLIEDLLRWAGQYDHRLSMESPKETTPGSDFIPAKLWQGLSRCQQSPDVQQEFTDAELQLTDQIHRLETLLSSLFQPGSVTYLRYQSAITSVAGQTLENLETYRLLFSQVWEQGSQDHAYWNGLVAPIKQRHLDYLSALQRLQTSLTETIAQQKPDTFQLNDLEALTERLKHYQ
ncbi:DEAD/DEAH box helicase [Reinekea blandensis]|uniref:AAA+ ATPase domain-containing protein n=1 Tax=Reinekea blandensis MED297 TaxID=314283 RepID=A4BJ79_9GAMM|nr:AAA domain-containing protein [Reinekea blandensis]EAR07832.1 hypothetical protein MED297_05289 [Reinekea sp. MED297] [Reinekea blandensis MED297]